MHKLWNSLILSSEMEGQTEENAQETKPLTRLRIQRVWIVRQHWHVLLQGN